MRSYGKTDWLKSIGLAVLITILILPGSYSCQQDEEEQSSTESHDESNPEDHKINYTIEVFNSDSGWGYNILKNNAILIHQPHIPAIQGTLPFATEQQAKQTALLMVHKLGNGIMPPAISINELDSLGVSR